MSSPRSTGSPASSRTQLRSARSPCRRRRWWRSSPGSPRGCRRGRGAVLAVWLSSRAVRDRRDLCAWLALCVIWLIARDPPPPGALRVTFLDIGQGDAAIVELPDGAVWVIDSGGLPNGRDPSAPGRTIDRVLAAYGHTRVDLAILSHPHPDHFLGFTAMQTPINERWAARELEGPDQFAAWTHPALGAIHHGDVELDVLAPRYSDGPSVYE